MAAPAGAGENTRGRFWNLARLLVSFSPSGEGPEASPRQTSAAHLEETSVGSHGRGPTQEALLPSPGRLSPVEDEVWALPCPHTSPWSLCAPTHWPLLRSLAGTPNACVCAMATERCFWLQGPLRES